jgi:hypothetical protein
MNARYLKGFKDGYTEAAMQKIAGLSPTSASRVVEALGSAGVGGGLGYYFSPPGSKLQGTLVGSIAGAGIYASIAALASLAADLAR